MLIQMNNAALLEAYATLGISPRPAKIDEQAYPDGFSLAKALTGLPFGQEDKSEHPGKIHDGGSDPILEAERGTSGQADDTLSLAAAISARFKDQIGDGGELGALVKTAMAASGLHELDFDPDTFATGASVLASMKEMTSSVPDFAGTAPFSGMRMDYRPETAPMGPKKDTANRHSYESTHTGQLNIPGTLDAVFSAILKSRKRGAGTGKTRRRGGTHLDRGNG
ncbi:hypothetical protein CX676_14700 [Paracoccus zhejiangensis]|uniref:Uncharacterized protein n=2 Tax=Paracoccus zhejiangensis TaxID=1077935 RepID=A0A2H5F125_9RHOB|nr:hypothetical protein CX676_14700 [Paracoccus zhejiangensis]